MKSIAFVPFRRERRPAVELGLTERQAHLLSHAAQYMLLLEPGVDGQALDSRDRGTLERALARITEAMQRSRR